MATALSVETETRPTLREPAKHYEVVNGRVVEAPPLGAYEGWIADELGRAITLFDPDRRLGRVVTEGLFMLENSPTLKRRPDLAFVSAERWPTDRPAPRQNGWDVIPDLAVEVSSPTDRVAKLLIKVREYFRNGVRLVWVVHPGLREVYVYRTAVSVQILQIGDELDGGDVMPGFRLPLATLFGPEPTEVGPTQEG